MKKLRPGKRGAPVVVHVNMHTIKANRKHGTNLPPLTGRVGRGGKSFPAHTVTFYCPECEWETARVVHSPHKPLACGARVWIEADGEVTLLP